MVFLYLRISSLISLLSLLKMMERELWWFVPKRVWQAEIWESKPIFFWIA